MERNSIALSNSRTKVNITVRNFVTFALFCRKLNLFFFVCVFFSQIQKNIFTLLLAHYTVRTMWSYLAIFHSVAMKCQCMLEALRLLPLEKND